MFWRPQKSQDLHSSLFVRIDKDVTSEPLVKRWQCHNHAFSITSTRWNVYSALPEQYFLLVCYYHVTYAFQGKSKLYSCLSVKELFARDIWSLSDSSEIRTHNHLVRKRILKHLAKLAIMIITYIQMHRTDKSSQHSSIIWLVWLNGLVFVYELSGCGFESRCCHLNSFCIEESHFFQNFDTTSLMLHWYVTNKIWNAR